eukprot:scaffold5159_cov112-Cylindrotheca_fusiformis.AAC.6
MEELLYRFAGNRTMDDDIDSKILLGSPTIMAAAERLIHTKQQHVRFTRQRYNRSFHGMEDTPSKECIMTVSQSNLLSSTNSISSTNYCSGLL